MKFKIIINEDISDLTKKYEITIDDKKFEYKASMPEANKTILTPTDKTISDDALFNQIHSFWLIVILTLSILGIIFNNNPAIDFILKIETGITAYALISRLEYLKNFGLKRIVIIVTLVTLLFIWPTIQELINKIN